MARLQTTVAIEVFGRRLPHDTHNIYEVRFFGDSILTTVTHDGAIVSQWISDVESIHRRRLQYLIVGLAVEWRPPFNSYSKNPVATIQLSVGRRCLIFRLIYCSFIPSSLVNFLANPNYTFVGVGINQNLEKLREDYQFGHNTNAVDLRSLAADAYGRKELKHAGVKELARVVLKKEVDKPKAVTMSRWDNQWLTPAQVQYACVDAFVCFEVGRILNASSSSSSTASSSSSAPVIASGQSLPHYPSQKKETGAAAKMAHPQTTTMAIEIVDHELPYDTHNTYEVRFFGDSIFTTVTHDGAIASKWISDVESIHRPHLQQLIVGLDVEWRPSFNRYRNNPAATIQLSVGRQCLIFQLIYCSSIPSSLVNFLANPNYTFVGVGINYDLEKLEEEYDFGYNTNAVDLRSLAAEVYGQKELKNAGLKTLAKVVLDKEVDKPKRVTMSRWDNQWLTLAQVQYACVDAFVCFEIGRTLNAAASSSSAATSSSAPVIASGQSLPHFPSEQRETSAAAEMANPQTTTMAIEIVDHELPYDTHNTYEVRFFGDSIFTTVTHDGAIASQWISDVESSHRPHLQHLIVGLDLEWRPSFNRYVSYPVATIQLSVGRRCLIFQLVHCSSIPSSLVNFLANPNYTFVGVGINQDLEKLEEDYEFGYNTNAVDLRGLAADAYDRKELKNAGVKELARVVMGKEVDKPKRVTMSRWDYQWLTPAQVKYACVDAYVCFEIGRILKASSPSTGSSSAASSSSASVRPR